MPLAMQAKLLRVLENHEIQRVGSPATRTVEVRVIGATNRDLPSLIRQGGFREDLYFRLSMVELRVPSLAERPEDLPLLERRFIQSFATQYGKNFSGLTRRAQTLLSRHGWPGNVRELENVIGHACMMTESEVLDIRDLPERVRDQSLTMATTATGDCLVSLEQMERSHTQNVLDRVGGNKVRAAEILGISRTQLYRIMKESSPELAPQTGIGVTKREAAAAGSKNQQDS
jgi:transcriptional regulator with PAS, ATPase and Fis domain